MWSFFLKQSDVKLDGLIVHASECFSVCSDYSFIKKMSVQKQTSLLNALIASKKSGSPSRVHYESFSQNELEGICSNFLGMIEEKKDCQAFVDGLTLTAQMQMKTILITADQDRRATKKIQEKTDREGYQPICENENSVRGCWPFS